MDTNKKNERKVLGSNYSNNDNKIGDKEKVNKKGQIFNRPKLLGSKEGKEAFEKGVLRTNVNSTNKIQVKKEREESLFFPLVQGALLIVLIIYIGMMFILPLNNVIGKSLIIVIILILIGLVVNTILKRKEHSHDELKSISFLSLAVTILLTLGLFFMFFIQSQIIKRGFNIMGNITVKNQVLSQEVSSLENKLELLKKDYLKKLDKSKIEKLQYGEKVKNKTIDIIINNLEYFKKQDISNIDINEEDTKQEESKKNTQKKVNK